MQAQCICLCERTHRRIDLCACISVQQCMQPQHTHCCALTRRCACSCACSAMHVDAVHADACDHIVHVHMHSFAGAYTPPTSVCTCSNERNLQQAYLYTFAQMHAPTCMHLCVHAATHAIVVGEFVCLHVQVCALMCMHLPLHPASHTVAIHAFACMHTLTDANTCMHAYTVRRTHLHASPCACSKTHKCCRCIQVHALAGADAHMTASLCMWSSTCDCNMRICMHASTRACTNTCNCSTCTVVHAAAGETTRVHASLCMQQHMQSQCMHLHACPCACKA